MKIKTEEIYFDILKEKKIKLFIKRIDQINECISGNKWYKLKYNMIEARRQNAKSILTFGGAYSNNISATAFLAKNHGFRSIGIIRGEEHLPLNPTLKYARKNGMELHYVSRKEYNLKSSVKFLTNLIDKLGKFYLIPEGGTNRLAIKGCEEILDVNDKQDWICCSVGTGGTIAGIINSKNDYQNVIGFSVIKNLNLIQNDIQDWTTKGNWNLLNDYSYGGYAMINKGLIDFLDIFYKTQKIPLDAIYTGKMMMGILDLVSKDYFPPGSSILSLHTGGLQGNKGMNERFSLQLPLK